MEILIFASNDSSHAAEAQKLAAEVGGRFIDRLSSCLDDLMLVTQYKVVEPIVIVVLAGQSVVLRIPRLVSATVLRRDLRALE